LILFGWKLGLEGISGVALYLLGSLARLFLLTSLYLVMPVVHITFRRALIGGVAATVLWRSPDAF